MMLGYFLGIFLASLRSQPIPCIPCISTLVRPTPGAGDSERYPFCKELCNVVFVDPPCASMCHMHPYAISISLSCVLILSRRAYTRCEGAMFVS